MWHILGLFFVGHYSTISLILVLTLLAFTHMPDTPVFGLHLQGGSLHVDSVTLSIVQREEKGGKGCGIR